MPQFWGKYRGVVVDNVDPLEQGRLIVTVPAVLGGVMTAWAMPCVPYAGSGVGFCMPPPIGAALWVEFEGGDPDYPIWTGCFWRTGERPLTASPPTMRMIQTSSGKLAFNDLDGEGGFTLSVAAPAVAIPVTVTANSSGLKIAVAEISIAIEQMGVTITASPARTAILSSGVTVAHGAATISLAAPMVSINEGALAVE
jgi:hypothetical protein